VIARTCLPCCISDTLKASEPDAALTGMTLTTEKFLVDISERLRNSPAAVPPPAPEQPAPMKPVQSRAALGKRFPSGGLKRSGSIEAVAAPPGRLGPATARPAAAAPTLERPSAVASHRAISSFYQSSDPMSLAPLQSSAALYDAGRQYAPDDVLYASTEPSEFAEFDPLFDAGFTGELAAAVRWSAAARLAAPPPIRRTGVRLFALTCSHTTLSFLSQIP
jgi:hypothetical protein